MIEIQNQKKYDLEERTFIFARDCRVFVKTLPKNITNAEDARQLIKSSGSMGANYIEANEALGKKDFVFRVKVCRKESKESRYWLRLIDTGGDEALKNEKKRLIQEATELMMIFSSIMRKAE